MFSLDDLYIQYPHAEVERVPVGKSKSIETDLGDTCAKLRVQL